MQMDHGSVSSFPMSHPNEWAVLPWDVSSLLCFQEKGTCFGCVNGGEGRGDFPEPDGAAGWGWKLSLSSGHSPVAAFLVHS